MEKPSKQNREAQTKLQELVVVTFAENLAQAKDYEAVLKANEIPAMVKEQYKQSEETSGIAVLVPEDFIDEAHVIIESQDAYDDFYDLTLEDEVDDDFFDDDF